MDSTIGLMGANIEGVHSMGRDISEEDEGELSESEGKLVRELVEGDNTMSLLIIHTLLF